MRKYITFFIWQLFGVPLLAISLIPTHSTWLVFAQMYCILSVAGVGLFAIYLAFCLINNESKNG
jgi:hypothetical protein